MSNTVDPILVPVPTKWRQDPEIGPFMDYMMRFWLGLYDATNYGEDQTTNFPFEDMISQIGSAKEDIQSMQIDVEMKEQPKQTDDFARQYAFFMGL